MMRDGREIPPHELPLQKAAATGQAVYGLELDLGFEDGSRGCLIGNAVPFLDEEGHSRGSVGVFVDITERKQNEERLWQAQKLESIGLLAGGIAHDFNNLLTVIIGNADCALHRYPSIEELRHIITASERAAELTRQLLAYAGKSQFVATTFNLRDLVSRSTRLLSASIPKRVKLAFHSSEQELPIKADPSQIEQILMNLVINAGEAIPPHSDGRVEIATSVCEVALETVRAHAPAFDARPGRFVCLEVTDNGSGMDEATLTQIFDPFFSTKFTGRGLGLAAVQGIVRSCGGFIEVHSSSGAGSTFRVFLPATAKKPAAEIPAVARPGATRPRDLRHPVILVVDDEEMVRKLACMALRSHGYEVLEAKNGRDALEVLAGAAPRPSLALLDLTMPVMGGEELVPILNQDYPNLRIILTSGYPEEETRRGFPPGAVAGFLQKPYTVATLTEKVEETFNSGGPNEETPAAA
jgi:signal transduction histidine kinase/ActR/RegA family two-component response regulator